MSNREIGIMIFYMLLFGACGFAFGHSVGVEQQANINAKLKEEYDALDTQYDRDLQSCYIKLDNLQNKYELGA